jgi:hypothetical protein
MGKEAPESEAPMTEALQEAIEQIQQLDPDLQDFFAIRIQEMLAALAADPRTQEAIARQDAEWRARLPEQLARIARGDYNTPTYANEEEMFAALDAIPYTGEEQEE